MALRTTINYMSACAGIGGLDLGFSLGVERITGESPRAVCYIEREIYCAAVLRRRMEEKALDEAPVWSDMRSFDGRPWRGLVDCIIGGYPCQPFSFAGKRRGVDDERHLWPSIARVIGEAEPGLVFFENVAGHLTLGFDVVRADIERLGYRVAAGLFEAAEVGAPHKRQRLFLLAHHPSRGCGELRAASGCEGRFEQNGGELADAQRAGAGSGESGEQGCQRGGRDRHAKRGRELADAGSQRPQGIGKDGPAAGAVGRGDGTSLPLFPPGPGERERWADIIGRYPELSPATQPGVRNVVNGAAARLDRLRALGNGAVPLAAAYAFVSLWACLQE